MTIVLRTAVLKTHRSGVLTALFGCYMVGLCHMKLLPSRRTFSVHYTTVHQFTMSLHLKPQVCVAYALCLAVPCHPQLCLNDRDLLPGIVVTRRWNGQRKKKKKKEKKKIVSALLQTGFSVALRPQN